MLDKRRYTFVFNEDSGGRKGINGVGLEKGVFLQDDLQRKVAVSHAETHDRPAGIFYVKVASVGASQSSMPMRAEEDSTERGMRSLSTALGVSISRRARTQRAFWGGGVASVADMAVGVQSALSFPEVKSLRSKSCKLVLVVFP